MSLKVQTFWNYFIGNINFTRIEGKYVIYKI